MPQRPIAPVLCSTASWVRVGRAPEGGYALVHLEKVSTDVGLGCVCVSKLRLADTQQLPLDLPLACLKYSRLCESYYNVMYIRSSSAI